MSIRRQQLGSVFTFLATTVALACGGSSPTAPGGGSTVASGLSVVVQSASLAPKEALIRRHLEETWQRASQQIDLDGLVVSVSTQPGRIIPEWGVGGTASNGKRVEISIDPDLAEDLLAIRLPFIAAHEFHHIARQRGPGYGNTLLQAMVSEGMADIYAVEFSGEAPPPWSKALSSKEIDQWIERARPEFDARRYNHADWFFGAGPQIPRWTGYTVGFDLIADYQDTNPGATGATLVGLGADAFRP